MGFDKLWPALAEYGPSHLFLVFAIVGIIALFSYARHHLAPGTERLAADQKGKADAIAILRDENARLVEREREAHVEQNATEKRLRECETQRARDAGVLGDPALLRARALKLERDAEPLPVATLGHVLVVEDNPQARDILRRQLTGFGYSVKVAHSGAVGLELVRTAEEPFSVIILDYMMPEMDGMEMLQRLRDEGVTTPVLFLTGFGEGIDKVRAQQLGARRVFTKPVEQDDLREAVAAAAGG